MLNEMKFMRTNMKILSWYCLRWIKSIVPSFLEPCSQFHIHKVFRKIFFIVNICYFKFDRGSKLFFNTFLSVFICVSHCIPAFAFFFFWKWSCKSIFILNINVSLSLNTLIISTLIYWCSFARGAIKCYNKYGTFHFSLLLFFCLNKCLICLSLSTLLPHISFICRQILWTWMLFRGFQAA